MLRLIFLALLLPIAVLVSVISFFKRDIVYSSIDYVYQEMISWFSPLRKVLFILNYEFILIIHI